MNKLGKNVAPLVIVALLTGLLSLDACDRRDPCPLSRQTNADFRIYSKLDYYKYEKGTSQSVTKIIEEDTFMVNDYIIFEALDTSAEVQSYEWRVGNDPWVRTGRKIELFFNPWRVDDVNLINVQLVVNKKPDPGCFPNDNGVDTLTRQITLLNYEKWPVLGSYYGSDDTDPDNEYTIKIVRKIPPGLVSPSTWLENPLGACNNGMHAEIDGAAFEFTTGRFEFINRSKSKECLIWSYDRNIGYLTPDRRGIVIEYGYRELVRSKFVDKKKIFTGIRQ